MSDTIFPLLAVDAGNTRIKWGLREGARWRATGSVETRNAASLAEAVAGLPRPARAIASNVAGPEVQAKIEDACRQAGAGVAFIRPQPEQLGVTNGYRDPGQLGADRWAAVVAAHRLGGGHKVVVNAGTALTIDGLAADGRFLGGLIVPGPALMRRSLDRGTAGLRLTEGAFARLPRSTPDAITTGAIQACIGAIARFADGMRAEGIAPEAIVLSGGAAGEIAPYLPLPAAIHENLVLDGLAWIAGAGAGS